MIKRNSLYDYDRWENFTKSELTCRDTGKENPDVKGFSEFMDHVQALRNVYGKRMVVTSAYRSPEHHKERDKPYSKLGEHTRAAIDFRVPVQDCWEVLELAFQMGFTGIGINLKGDPKYRFIHLDRREDPRVWSY